MDTSLTIARILGPFLLINGLFLIKNFRQMKILIEEIIQSQFLIYLIGILALLPGLLIINIHNIWSGDWRITITLLGWIMTISGLFRIFFPEKVKNISQSFFTRNNVILPLAIITSGFGIWLSYHGYVN